MIHPRSEFIYVAQSDCTIRSLLQAHGHSTHFIRQVMHHDGVWIGGLPSRSNSRLFKGTEVLVKIPEEECTTKPVPREIEILYADGDILAVIKPHGLAVHPAPGVGEDSLSGRVAHFFRQEAIFRKLRPIHRLDKDTAGIVLFALHGPAQDFYRRRWHGDEVQKYYEAVVEGMVPPHGVIDEPIGEDGGAHRFIDPEGKPAKTEFWCLGSREGRSRLRIKLYTGRTHQIRVHLAHCGWPIVGDRLYGNQGEKLHLFAKELVLPRMENGEILHLAAPDFLKEVL